MAGGLFVLSFVTGASASTLDGVATIATPTNDAPLTSGGSTTQFTIILPANAACSGDTASDGYHVYSYLVQQGSSVAAVVQPLTFTTQPSAGYGLLDASGSYFGSANTAITTGQVIGIPTDFEWEPLASGVGLTGSNGLLYSGSSGVWEAGIACANTSGVLTDYWNIQVTFTSSLSDPNGFVWSTSGSTTTTTSTTSEPSSTTSTTTGTSTTSTTSDPSSTTSTTSEPSSTTSTTTSTSTTSTTSDPTSTTSTTSAPSTTSTTGDPSSTSTSSTTSSTSSTASTTSTTSATGGASTTSTTTGGTPNPSSASSGGVGGTSGGTGSSGTSSSTGSGSTGGALAFTGMPTSVVKMLGAGLLGIGIGLMILASDRSRRPRALASSRWTLW